MYDAFRAGDPNLSAICDRVAREVDIAGELFVPILGEAVRVLGEVQAQRQAQERGAVELGQRLARAEHEAGELRERLQRVLTEAAAAQRQQGAVAHAVDGRALPPAPGVEEAFPRWIAARGTTALARADWVAERVRQWPLAPRLALGMILPPGGEAGIWR